MSKFQCNLYAFSKAYNRVLRRIKLRLVKKLNILYFRHLKKTVPVEEKLKIVAKKNLTTNRNHISLFKYSIGIYFILIVRQLYSSQPF